MEKKAESRKVRYTKMVLREALLELMQTHPINKITVKMISEQADVNRGTFYAYYRDSYDLLRATENELLSAVKSNLLEYTMDNSLENIFRVFNEIEKNRELCRILFSENGDKEFVRRILYIAHDNVVTEWQNMYPNTKPHLLDIAYNYLVTGSAAVLSDWVIDDGGMSIQDIVSFLIGFWENGMSSFKS